MAPQMIFDDGWYKQMKLSISLILMLLWILAIVGSISVIGIRIKEYSEAITIRDETSTETATITDRRFVPEEFPDGYWVLFRCQHGEQTINDHETWSKVKVADVVNVMFTKHTETHGGADVFVRIDHTQIDGTHFPLDKPAPTP